MTIKSSPLPNDTDSPDRIQSTKPIGPGEKQLAPAVTTGQPFASYMQTEGAGPAAAKPAGQVSPFDLAHGQALTQTPNINTLLAQVNSAQSGLGDIVNQLNTPNLKLKQSSKYILKNKLSDAESHLRATNTKLGGKEIPPPQMEPGAGPIQKLIAYAANGQNNLQEAERVLKELQAKGDQLNPGDMLQIQIKLNQAQLEIQYSSVLLSTAVEDMKTLFNITL
jgi:hypothetical protein